MRTIDPVNFDYTGPPGVRGAMCQRARGLLGKLTATLGSLEHGVMSYQYPDGVTIKAIKHYGQYKAIIDVPFEEEDEKEDDFAFGAVRYMFSTTERVHHQYLTTPPDNYTSVDSDWFRFVYSRVSFHNVDEERSHRLISFDETDETPFLRFVKEGEVVNIVYDFDNLLSFLPLWDRLVARNYIWYQNDNSNTVISPMRYAPYQQSAVGVRNVFSPILVVPPYGRWKWPHYSGRRLNLRGFGIGTNVVSSGSDSILLTGFLDEGEGNQVLSHAAYRVVSGRGFIIQSFIDGGIYVVPVDSIDITTGKATYYKEMVVPWPAWVTHDGDLPDDVPCRVVWHFDSAATRAITVAVNATPSVRYDSIRMHSNAVEQQPDGVSYATWPLSRTYEYRPGLLEIEFDIVVTGGEIDDFEVSCTVIKNDYFGTTGRWWVAADYAFGNEFLHEGQEEEDVKPLVTKDTPVYSRFRMKSNIPPYMGYVNHLNTLSDVGDEQGNPNNICVLSAFWIMETDDEVLYELPMGSVWWLPWVSINNLTSPYTEMYEGPDNNFRAYSSRLWFGTKNWQLLTRIQRPLTYDLRSITVLEMSASGHWSGNQDIRHRWEVNLWHQGEYIKHFDGWGQPDKPVESSVAVLEVTDPDVLQSYAGWFLQQSVYGGIMSHPQGHIAVYYNMDWQHIPLDDYDSQAPKPNAKVIDYIHTPNGVVTTHKVLFSNAFSSRGYDYWNDRMHVNNNWSYVSNWESNNLGGFCTCGYWI